MSTDTRPQVNLCQADSVLTPQAMGHWLCHALAHVADPFNPRSGIENTLLTLDTLTARGEVPGQLACTICKGALLQPWERVAVGCAPEAATKVLLFLKDKPELQERLLTLDSLGVKEDTEQMLYAWFCQQVESEQAARSARNRRR